MITPDLVRYLFDYSPEGVLTWRANRGKRARAGAVAGSRARDGFVITIDGKKYTRRRLVWAWWKFAWPTHSVCSLNNDCFDDRIEFLADLNDVERRHNLVEQQRGLPVGVHRASHEGKRYTAACDHEYLGTFDTPEAAHEAYRKAHVSKYGSMSPYSISICTYATGDIKCL